MVLEFWLKSENIAYFDDTTLCTLTPTLSLSIDNLLLNSALTHTNPNKKQKQKYPSASCYLLNSHVTQNWPILLHTLTPTYRTVSILEPNMEIDLAFFQ